MPLLSRRLILGVCLQAQRYVLPFPVLLALLVAQLRSCQFHFPALFNGPNLLRLFVMLFIKIK